MRAASSPGWAPAARALAASSVRHADDFVIAFEREEDAARVMNVLPRLGRYGLTVHPEKTRLVPFRRPMEGRGAGKKPQPRRPETFDLLGFTH